MQTIPVSSSMIQAAEYDIEQQQLHITFNSGDSWVYGDSSVPFTQEEADAFASAPSAGRYFLNNIKGQYPERRG